ncbi:DNA polymerase IV [Gordonia sp. HY285]|uniref:DNA polymerase IV n=1 Tax=Gordonia liuliyuniae TaxID=2911517 RepID=UPI001F010E55|nr:DNA polymerase IV [Gordonia liuliyuniae]MCF8612041.1 DNA polymerase IV [Gordonia liuliyuniae]
MAERVDRAQQQPPTRFRWLLHIDVDQFQVAAERLRRPDLVGVRVIVGGDGDPSRPRQVVTCASYEARGDGARAGLPLPAARRKSPDAVFLPLDMAYYTDVSERVMDVVRAQGSPVEVWGFDEAYLGVEPRDATPMLTAAEVVAFADRLRTAVLDETGLECCLGVSDNKQRAKMAAGFAKAAVRRPDAPAADRIFVLDDGNWPQLMGPRSCRDLWSVGPRTAARLADHGVDTVEQLQTVPLEDLISMFGPSQGNWLYVLCRGGGDDAIATAPWIAKSHSRSRTYPRDLTDREEVRDAAADLTREVLAHAVAEQRLPFRVGLTVRTSTFYTRTKVRRLAEPTVEYAEIIPVVDSLVDAFELDRPVRLLAVRLELEDV